MSRLPGAGAPFQSTLNAPLPVTFNVSLMNIDPIVSPPPPVTETAELGA
jgi:hypothetical protein